MGPRDEFPRTRCACTKCVACCKSMPGMLVPGDAAAILAACRRLGLAEPVHGATKLFSGEVSGLAVALPGWHYPVVCDVATGQVQFDNFNGIWGEQQQLDKFLQAYACERAKIEARKRGHSVTEQQLSDGSIKLTIQVAGGAA